MPLRVRALTCRGGRAHCPLPVPRFSHPLWVSRQAPRSDGQVHAASSTYATRSQASQRGRRGRGLGVRQSPDQGPGPLEPSEGVNPALATEGRNGEEVEESTATGITGINGPSSEASEEHRDRVAAEEGGDSEGTEEGASTDASSSNDCSTPQVWTEAWAKENANRLSHLSPDLPLWVSRRQQSQEKQARIVSHCPSL